MKRILGSAGTIVVLAAALVGGTGAFFSDMENSTGNTFAAGVLDLKIDNESYYNRNVCVDIDETEEGENFVWQGSAGYPEPGTSCITSFPGVDLDDGFLFFSFDDLKPDDEGEDTISIHVQNDAWVCMDLTLTSNDDNSSNEPELGSGDPADSEGDAWDGELAEALEFFWWADDGDNVYEEGENAISDGVQSLLALAPQNDSFSIALADSQNNVWGEEGDPVPANSDVYIAKAWCLGDLALAPVPDGDGENPSINPGVVCEGVSLGNEFQTDGVELNVVFSAMQARDNDEFLCNPEVRPLPTLTVNKILTVDTQGISVEDFELHIDLEGAGGDQIVGDNVPVPNLAVGNYNVYEIISDSIPDGVTFTTTFGGACDPAGNVTLALGDNKVCTISNVEND